MYAEERQHAIAGLVAERGRVAVASVAERFGVTTETVRRDLAVLERAGVVRRVHGGAVPAGAAFTLVETGLGERHGTRTEAKRKIAAAALDLLPGMDGSVILDGGTSTAALADVLPPDRRLYVATNSVPIAARLSAIPGLTLHLLGGRVRGITQTAVGDSTVRAMADLRVDVAFLGTNGISAFGFSTPDEAEAATKRAMVTAAQKVVVLADSSKIGREHLVRFASVHDVDVLITDGEAEPEAVAELETLGIEVLVA
jgi:DeoR family transcriptional regulator, fructose operon transcriptional repressor